MADNGDVSKRLEAARLMRAAAKLLEDSESSNKKETTNSNTAQLQKLFSPYSSEGKILVSLFNFQSQPNVNALEGGPLCSTHPLHGPTVLSSGR